MQNPAIREQLSNPRVIQAMEQIRNGMQQLHAEAPDLFPQGGAR